MSFYAKQAVLAAAWFVSGNTDNPFMPGEAWLRSARRWAAKTERDSV